MKTCVSNIAIKLLVIVSLSFEVQAQDKVPPIGCLENNQTIEYWRGVREDAANSDADSLVLPLADCLRQSNAELRDRIAYEVLTYWLRNNKVSDQNVSRLRLKLVPWLKEGAGSRSGDSSLSRAFAALVLSEVVRYDNIENSMAGEEVFELHKAATEMFVAERDYRGLTVDQGWIHTIAHGADLLWRLAMHSLTGPERQREILAALLQQIARPGIPAYTFNEGDRLARVVAVLIARDELADEEIEEWITLSAEPVGLDSWSQAFTSPTAMAQLHNQKQFLRALKEAIEGRGNDAVMSALTAALTAMP